jgi:hypothetical protein
MKLIQSREFLTNITAAALFLALLNMCVSFEAKASDKAMNSPIVVALQTTAPQGASQNQGLAQLNTSRISPAVAATQINIITKSQQIHKQIDEVFKNRVQGLSVGYYGMPYANYVATKYRPAAEACINRVYTATENYTAGCTNIDSNVACEEKLFDWCMTGIRVALKQSKDDIINQINSAFDGMRQIYQMKDGLVPR